MCDSRKKVITIRYILYNHTVTFFETTSPHYANSFIAYPQLKNNVYKYCYLSDRVCRLSYPRLKNTYAHQRNIFRIQGQYKFESYRNRVSYKCLTIPKITFKQECVSGLKHLISIINMYRPIIQLDIDVYVFDNFYSNTKTIW